MQKIGVIGGGAWGTALAQAFCAGGRDVTLWARESEVVSAINTRHENTPFLPDVPLDKNLKATGDLKALVQSVDVLLLVTPAQYMRASLLEMRDDLPETTPLVICSKGVELDTELLLSQVAAEIVPRSSIAILTGPTFASEIARGLPCAVTLAAQDEALLKILQETLGVKNLRPYITQDIIGTQLGGAIKNVMAIACGMIHGRGFGESARAALITRALAEMMRLSVAMGGQSDTLMGMCGMGDLMLTCSSMQSRNFSLGAALGQGKSLEEILGQRNAVTEGVHTARATLDLANKYGVDMPIAKAVSQCLNEGLPLDQAIEEMLGRPLKYEK